MGKSLFRIKRSMPINDRRYAYRPRKDILDDLCMVRILLSIGL